MALLNRYEDAAHAFLETYPIGTTVRGEEMVTWAHDHADGLQPDLVIPEPGKKIASIRKHLNQGGASRAFMEAERFYIDVTDTKRQVFLVRSLFEQTNLIAQSAVAKSAKGALNPLKQTAKALADIKKDELSDEQRAEIEEAERRSTVQLTPLRKAYGELLSSDFEMRLVAKGYPPGTAAKLMEDMPQLEPMRRLISWTQD